MAGIAHYRLIITAQKEKGIWSGGLKNETAIHRALKNHLGMSALGSGQQAIDVCISFLISGRPYVLPLLFDESEAKSFAANLRTAGCDVEIVPFGQ
jgi:hypothetical protein